MIYIMEHKSRNQTRHKANSCQPQCSKTEGYRQERNSAGFFKRRKTNRRRIKKKLLKSFKCVVTQQGYDNCIYGILDFLSDGNHFLVIQQFINAITLGAV